MSFRYEEIDKMNKNNITMGEFFNLFSFGSSVPVIITLSDGIQDDMIEPIYEGFLSDTPIWLSNHCLITKVPKDVEEADLVDVMHYCVAHNGLNGLFFSTPAAGKDGTYHEYQRHE